MAALLPNDETERLAALHDHKILDTAPESEFDDLVRLAAHLCGVPIAAVSLVDEHRQWFKASIGLAATETSRESSFCAHAILQPDLLIVPDAEADPRFADNPLVTGDPRIRFYAGMPLVTDDGYALGSLCVIDRKPRILTPDQQETLRLLGRQVASQLRAVRRVAEREQLMADKERLSTIVETSEDAIYSMTLDATITSWNHGAESLYGYTAAEIIGQRVDLFVPAGRRAELRHILHTIHLGEDLKPLETVRVTKTGALVDVSLRCSPILGRDGNVIGASVIARDITPRKYAEATLNAEREFTHTLLENLQEGIVACDAQGKLTLLNRTMREMHSLPEQSLSPERWAEHFDLYEADGVTPMRAHDVPLFRALQGEAVHETELVVAPKFGSSRTLIANGKAIYSASGEKLGAVVALHDVTERRRAEREIARLAAIVEHSEEAILAATLDGTIISWNRGAERLYGYAAAEMVGRHVSTLTQPGEQSPVPAVATRLLRGKAVAPIEVLRTRRDGTEFHAALSFSPIKDTTGHIVGISCVARDITARKQAEEALAESEARLRRLTDAAFEGIAVGQDGIVVDVSPAFATMFGYDTPTAMIGMTGLELVAPESHMLVTRKVAEGNESLYEATLLRRDGTTFQAEMRGRLIQLGGRPARVTAVRDITERKAMETALRDSNHAFQESEARFRTSVDAMEEGMALQGMDGAILMCNASAERILGLTADQMAGRTSLDPRWRSVREDGTDFPGDQHPAMVALREGTPQRNVVMGVHKPSGEMTWVNINAVPLLSTGQADAGTKAVVRGVVVTFSDITERRYQEEALRQSHDALQESQARLTEAQRLAKIGSWEYDLAAREITWSEELFRLFGLEPAGQAPDYETAITLYHPEDAPVLDALVARAFQEGIGYEIDLRGAPNPLQYGAFRWYHTVCTAVTDASGKVIRLVGTLADITDRKRMEAEQQESTERLRESEASLRAVLESAPVILYAADTEGIVTLSEGTGLAALGLKPGEVVGRSVHEFSVGDPKVDAYTRRALAGEAASYDSQYTGLCLHTELRPVRDAAETVTGIIGVCFDVTERVASEERFRVLFEQSSHAHILFNEESGIIDCNTMTLSMMRCTDKAQLIGTHPALFSPEFQPDGRRSDEKGAEMCALARSNGSHRFEWQRRAVDGYDYPVEVTLTPVTLGDNPVLLSVWHDLTERKRAEEQAKDYAVLLEFQMNELEEVNAQLENLATTDGLTGLKNHRTFQERLAEEVSRAARYGTPLSLILLDVDCFKSYNDVHGHPAGDAVLKSVAYILQDCARDTDVVARYGGEEFVLILPLTDLSGAAVFAERLRVAVECHPWPVRAVTASFGVACLHPADENGASLVVRADAALYGSKTGGRNRVTCDGVDKSALEASQAAMPQAEMLRSTEAVFVSDLKGVFLQINDCACELLGYMEGELIGTDGVDLIHPDDLAREGWRMDDVMVGHVVVTRRRLRCKDGTWLHTELRTERLAEGRVECVMREEALVEWGQYRLDENHLLREASEGFTMLDALVAAVDNKDRYTRRHSEDVMTYGLMIARELGMDAAAQDTVAAAALLHDVGKIGVPDAILRKPGSLTTAEFNAVKSHPQMGAAIVSTVPGLSATLGAVRHHHERWDGDGYPFGLRGEEIPFLARLMAVADAFSAMTTERPYRLGMPPEQALAVLAAGAGTQWDPQCVAAFQRACAQSNEPAKTLP